MLTHCIHIPMKTNILVRKWGNSLGVRIPAQAAREAGLHEDTVAQLTSEQGELTLRPIKTRRKRPIYNLEFLLRGYRPRKNTTKRDDFFGQSVGRELL
jgi:antitoxin MazE